MPKHKWVSTKSFSDALCHHHLIGRASPKIPRASSPACTTDGRSTNVVGASDLTKLTGFEMYKLWYVHALIAKRYANLMKL
jgi:hypothetical protein